MLIGLHDAELEAKLKSRNKLTRNSIKYSNLAIMKISTYHKQLGDDVVWWQPYADLMFDIKYDTVYSSKIFETTPDNRALPLNVIKGGTGYKIYENLPDSIEKCFPDYSLYPDYDAAIGFITRGCPNKCRWCIVPTKEGDIRPNNRWQEIIRKDTPNITLMDNNILACDYGIQQLIELSKTDYRIDINQGLDARLIDPVIARILSNVKYIKKMGGKKKNEIIRFSCDSQAQIPALRRAVNFLVFEGVKRERIMCYALVTADIKETAARIEEIKDLGVTSIYAQAEINPAQGIMLTRAMKEFAERYVKGNLYHNESWEQYCNRKQYDPYCEKLGKS